MAVESRSVLFRADAAPGLGIGHVMRCLTLAGALAARGWSCRLACTPETIATMGRTLRTVPVTVVGLDDPADPAQLLDLPPPHWLVVDHYSLDAAYEAALAGWAGRILVLDDLADRPHDCDLLLDQTVGRDADDYAGRLRGRTLVLTGPRFALLRPDFATGAAPERPLERILVALGGTDPGNASGLALSAIAQTGLTLPVSVVLGSGAPHLAAVKAQAAAMPGVEVLTDVTDMAGLMAACGLAVGAGGGSALERCRMALPTVLLVIADNQRMVAHGLEAAGAAVVAPLEIGAVAEALASLAGDETRRRAMARAGAALCDGKGAARLADLMELDLRPATMADGDVLLEWRNDPVTRANSLETGLVARDGHFAWLGRVLADPSRLLLMAGRRGVAVGMARFDRLEGGDWRVSLAVAPEARGDGLGRAVLGLAVADWGRRFGPGVLLAEIRAANHASRAVFAACGFRPAGGEGEILRYRKEVQ